MPPRAPAAPPTPVQKIRNKRTDLGRPAKPADWLAKPILKRRANALAVGDPGTLKSIVLGDLARAIVQGGSFLGMPVQHGAAPVVIFDGENDPDDVALARFAAYVPSLNGEREHLYHFYVPELGAMNRDEWLRIVREIVGDIRPRAVLFDSIASVVYQHDHFGDNDAARYMKDVGKLGFDFGTTVVTLMHNRKAQAGASRDPKQSVYGSVQYRAQATAHLHFKLEQQTKAVHEDGSARLQSVVCITDEKNRTDINTRPWYADVTSTMGADDVLRDLRVRAMGTDEARDLKADPNLPVVLDALEEADTLLSRKELRAVTDLPDTNLGRILETGLRKGWIVQPGGARTAYGRGEGSPAAPDDQPTI